MSSPTLSEDETTMRRTHHPRQHAHGSSTPVTALALACEMLETSNGNEVVQVCIVEGSLSPEVLAWPSTTTTRDGSWGVRTVLKTYVRPTGKIMDQRLSGFEEVLKAAPDDLQQALPRIREVLRGAIVVGHYVRKGLTYLGISHPEDAIHDTSELPKFLDAHGMPRTLKDLVWEHLHRCIKPAFNPHNQLEEDTKANMELYLRHWNLAGPAPRLHPHEKDEVVNLASLTCLDLA